MGGECLEAALMGSGKTPAAAAFARACDALAQEPPLPQNAATLGLQNKHPQSPLPDLAACFASRPRLCLSLVSFRRASSRTVWTSLYLLFEAFSTAHSNQVAAHLAGLCHLPVGGLSLLTIWLVGPCMPHGGRCQPITVGEVLQQLVCKLLARACAQRPVCTRSGNEAAIHVTGHNGRILLKLDFRKAFHRVSRKAVLQEACSRTHWVVAAGGQEWFRVAQLCPPCDDCARGFLQHLRRLRLRRLTSCLPALRLPSSKRFPAHWLLVACYYPFCDAVAGCFGDHARACPCGGDRCLGSTNQVSCHAVTSGLRCGVASSSAAAGARACANYEETGVPTATQGECLRCALPLT